jgi:hypothetical protein
MSRKKYLIRKSSRGHQAKRRKEEKTFVRGTGRHATAMSRKGVSLRRLRFYWLFYVPAPLFLAQILENYVYWPDPITKDK